jgi:2-haloacid dehalogenase
MSRIFMFDAYGTLFDVHSAVVKAGAALGEKAEPISQMWRVKQLEYTWTLSLMGKAGGRMADFAALTAAALDFVLARHGLSDPDLRERLLAAYAELDAFPDVVPLLQALKAAGHRTLIFTNGTRGMIDAAVAAAGLGPWLDGIVTVEAAGCFKPHPQVYAHAAQEAGASAPGEITFASSNRWDVAGASACGWRARWINRTGQPEEYPGFPPVAVRQGLAGLEAA